MLTVNRALTDFIEAWTEGRRPRVEDYLERVPARHCRELADDIGVWLEIAPTPDFPDSVWRELRLDPALVRMRNALDSEQGLLPAELRRLQQRVGIDTDALGRRLVRRLRLQGRDDAARATDYLHLLQSGQLDPRGLSQRLLEALAALLDTSPGALAAAAEVRRPAQGVRGSPAENLEPHDQLDRLFTGGLDG